MAKFQYRMIAEKILTDIRKEILLPGMNVPSSRDLSRIYGVSQITAVHALNFLAKRGVLLHKPGLYQAFSRTPPAHYCGGVPGFAAVTFPQQQRGLSRPY